MEEAVKEGNGEELARRVKRWRLVLGAESESRFGEMRGGEGISLDKEQLLMDQALAAIYDNSSEGGF